MFEHLTFLPVLFAGYISESKDSQEVKNKILLFVKHPAGNKNCCRIVKVASMRWKGISIKLYLKNVNYWVAEGSDLISL